MRAMLSAICVVAALIAVMVAPGSIPPCVFEDGSGQSVCYWDAATFGNGRGESYLMVGGERL